MKLKKIVIVVLTFAVVLALSATALATDQTYTAKTSDTLIFQDDPAVYELRDNTLYITVKEYDIYVNSLRRERALLQKAGYSTEEIDSSRTYDVENRLLALAALSESELLNRGYSKSQIKLMKEYDGTPLEEAPQMAAALSTMTATITAGDCTTQHITAHLNWQWDSAPAIYNYDDSVAVSYAAYNSSAIEIQASYNTSYTHSYVTYRNYLTNAFISTTSTTLTSNNVLHGVGTKFARLDNALTGYAKSGSFNCYIQLPSTVTASINNASFLFEYACPKTTVNYSLSFPAALTIEFSTSVDSAFRKQVTISSSGTIIASYDLL